MSLRSLQRIPRVGKLAREGTVYSEHLKNPKNADRHMTSIVRSSNGEKQPWRRIEINLLRMSIEIGRRAEEGAGEHLEIPRKRRRTAGIDNRVGELKDLKRN